MQVVHIRTEDIPDILRTSEECGLCLWSPEAYRAELCRNDSIMLKVVDHHDRFAGFAVGRIFETDELRYIAELTNIGVRQICQRQGFGCLLLKSFIEKCLAARVISIVLEVRASNATAIRFYQMFGFTQSGLRRSFYSHPEEDALTMQLVL